MNNKRNVIISILLIAIIIILLLFCRFGKIYHGDLIPTGNVDVFDINVFCNHKIKDKNTNDEATEENNKIYLNTGIVDEEHVRTDKNGHVIKNYNKQTDRNVLGEVFVDDANGNYLYQERLNIFTNPAYKFTNKIAPGVSNVYHFVVHNSNNIDVKYYIQMYEESEYKINMKYRLKCEDEYVIGNDNTWVDSNDLITEFKNLKMGSSDSYSLEWKWFDDDKNDTIAGKNMDSEYNLNIRFFFEAVNN